MYFTSDLLINISTNHTCKKTSHVECDVGFEQINDRCYMPVNLVNVLKYHDSLPCYHQLTLDKVKYLKYRFESPIFNNKYLGRKRA